MNSCRYRAEQLNAECSPLLSQVFASTRERAKGELTAIRSSRCRLWKLNVDAEGLFPLRLAHLLAWLALQCTSGVFEIYYRMLISSYIFFFMQGNLVAQKTWVQSFSLLLCREEWTCYVATEHPQHMGTSKGSAASLRSCKHLAGFDSRQAREKNLAKDGEPDPPVVRLQHTQKQTPCPSREIQTELGSKDPSRVIKERVRGPT